MTQETFRLLKEMDINAAETQILLRCAPLIAGVKVSNLLIIKKVQENDVRQLFEREALKYACVTLYRDRECSVMLLYRKRELGLYFTAENVKKMLYREGYRDFELQALLDTFAARFTSFREKQGYFPHEMGLFLGYPPEDVKGFIENKGRHALCAGYWKVYRNPAEKQRLFRGFDRAKEGLIRLAASGMCMEDMLKYG